MKYYSVYKGRNPGVYFTWNECKEQVEGFPQAKFRKFDNMKDAKFFSENGSIPEKPKPKPLFEYFN